MSFDIGAVRLDTKRPLRWRAVWLLSLLYVLGNAASIPLIQQTQPSRLEGPSLWALATTANFILIAISLYLAGRIGLGSPLLEGLLGRGERLAWARRTFSVAVVIAIAASLPLLLLNWSVDPERVPPLWTLFLASLDAGIQEEIFYRLFLLTFLAWLGGLIWGDDEGRPSSAVISTAIVVAGFIFGWAHVDDQILNHGAHPSLVSPMAMNSALGIAFGWLYWKQGLESAMLAHILVDAVNFVIVIPGFLSGSTVLRLAVVSTLLVAAIGAWRLLTKPTRARSSR